MKKRYTKRQICEAIAYWKKQLRKLDESTAKSFDAYAQEIHDLYDTEIVPAKDGYFTCTLKGIDPDKNFNPNIPWNIAVIRWFIDLVLEFNSRNSADNSTRIAISKVDFTSPGFGALVVFVSKSRDNLAKFIYDTMCTDEYDNV